jgi:AcrR family transcriptional regulator
MSVTMTTRTPARMPAEARREQLLDVAKAIVAGDGFHAISIEGLAREAGISRPIVYGHFRDLPGVLEALIEREGARALGQLGNVLPAALAEPDPVERLVRALGGYLEAVRADPDTWRLVLMPQEGAPRVLHEQIARGRAAVVGQLAAALEPAATPDPELAARLMSAVADEAARLLLADPGRYCAERTLELVRWFLRTGGAGSADVTIGPRGAPPG